MVLVTSYLYLIYFDHLQVLIIISCHPPPTLSPSYTSEASYFCVLSPLFSLILYHVFPCDVWLFACKLPLATET